MRKSNTVLRAGHRVRHLQTASVERPPVHRRRARRLAGLDGQLEADGAGLREGGRHGEEIKLQGEDSRVCD